MLRSGSLHFKRFTFTFLLASRRNNSSMIRLSEKSKTQSFTKAFPPDERVPEPSIAWDETKWDLTHKPRQLKSGAYSWVLPEKRDQYKLLTVSRPALNDLGLPDSEEHDNEFFRIVSGQAYNDNPTAQEREYPTPYSQCYAGWQFGSFAGQLGDGRVVNLFEIDNHDKTVKHEIQLKGSGKTPFSRFADGKAVVRSSVREYVISESLHALGIPTTRALAIVTLPHTWAQRHAAETCAITTRFAPSWIRIGTFDLYRWRGDRKGMRVLSDFVISDVFGGKETVINNFNNQGPEFAKIVREEWDEDKFGEFSIYDLMYLEIVVRNAKTVAQWQAYGFLNGVLNTDNTSVLGLSIDFGPFAIMDKFDPDFTSNSEDHTLRYSHRNTPGAVFWSLTRLGEDMAELIGAGPTILNDPHFTEEGIKKEWEDQIVTRATAVIEVAAILFEHIVTREYGQLLMKRIGLSSFEEADDQLLLDPLREMLKTTKLDYNNFFVKLQEAVLKKLDNEGIRSLAESIAESNEDNKIEELEKWLRLYIERLNKHGYEDVDLDRRTVSSKVNPLFLPRNWIFDEVIQKLADDPSDNRYLKKLEKMAFNPFDPLRWGHDLKDTEAKWLSTSDQVSMLQCSCSS
ncbi:BA75_01700T0 [Komagataella pastoris]|uniref:Selenoprotein O n=1 Tax=Komagataella pastoris TaxID=4922 RepID=A0A1B2J8F4_PICPA|nr:BA75_01700T0 [Komagataella pastoris]